MPESRRQEVLNVYLAQLLQERGVVASPESILKLGPKKTRAMPDVLVFYQGLRTAIEGEVESSNARDKALASAARRVEQGIAQIGVAVVYPEDLRQIDDAKLKMALTRAELKIAVTTEAETTGFVSGTIDYLERALRSAFEQLIKEDVVAEAVALLDAAVDQFAGAVLNYAGIWGRINARLNESLTDEELDNLSDAQKAAGCRVAGLLILNAMIFHDMLALTNRKIKSLDVILRKHEVSGIVREWDYILEKINYYAIFNIAADLFGDLVLGGWGVHEAVTFMAQTARKITQQRTALRHDLMGRVYHRLLAEAKYLDTYYTSIPAAALLLKVALRSEGWDTRWDNVEQVSRLRIADLSCGTGTLLTAAADAVFDNYVSASAALGKKVRHKVLHQRLAELVLHGYDVLPSAIHLTASTLAMRIPDIPLKKMNLFSLPLGGIEFLRGREVQMSLGDMFGALPKTQQVTGKEMQEREAAPMPDLDLCVMNPPFVRSVGGNLLFGSVPEAERTEMQNRLRRLITDFNVQANVTAGLGAVFVAAGDRYVKPGGRLALVLPKTLLSGVAWAKTRELINRKYRLDYVIVSHDAERWNFSESTDLSEVLVVATRNLNTEPNGRNGHQVTVVNLWHNPVTALEALAIAHPLLKADAPDLVSGQGALSLPLNGSKAGEVITYPWKEMQADWFLPCAFAQADLIRVAYQLLKGQVWLPGFRQQATIQLCPLQELGQLGPDRRDIHDGFEVGEAPTAYPTFWGHDADAVQTLAQQPNKYLAPLPKAKKGRPLRKVEDLWPLAGKIVIAERMWLKTQSIVSARLSRLVLSNVWWSFAFKPEVEKPDFDKALVVWMNSTLGLIVLLATRDETRGASVDFKKPSLGAMPVLDVRALSDEQTRLLADAYDRLAEQPLLPFPQMAEDDIRTSIDRAVAEALHLPDLSPLRAMLGREPVVSMKRLGN
jgi:hypothetical protein